MNKIKMLLVGVLLALGLSMLTACGGTQYEALCVNQFGIMQPYNLYCQPGGLYYSPFYHYYPVRVGFVSPGYGHTINHFQINTYNSPSKKNVKPATLPSNGAGKVYKPTSQPTAPKPGGMNKTIKAPAYKPAPKAPSIKK